MKCDSCKALRDGGLNPVCVDACMMRALDFGEVDDLVAKYGTDLVSELPALGTAETNPNIRIKAKEPASETSFKEVVL